MAKIETYACDICAVQKKETNEWWKTFLLDKDADSKIAGVLIIKWEIDSISKPLSRTELLPSKADGHLCGSKCLTEWLSKNLMG